MIGWLQRTGPLVHRLPALAAWVAIAGAGALVMAALLSGVMAPRWQAQAEAQLASAQRALQSSLQPSAAQTRVRMSGPEPEAEAELPPVAHTPERRAALMALARRHGVDVQRAGEQADGAGQLQLALAGRARYAALRAFVSAALRADPALVLDRLRMQRASATAAELDVDLQWTFLHRSPPLKSSVMPNITRQGRAEP